MQCLVCNSSLQAAFQGLNLNMAEKWRAANETGLS